MIEKRHVLSRSEYHRDTAGAKLTEHLANFLVECLGNRLLIFAIRGCESLRKLVVVEAENVIQKIQIGFVRVLPQELACQKKRTGLAGPAHRGRRLASENEKRRKTGQHSRLHGTTAGARLFLLEIWHDGPAAAGGIIDHRHPIREGDSILDIEICLAGIVPRVGLVVSAAVDGDN